jgi:tRNA(adenine34) deaminase
MSHGSTQIFTAWFLRAQRAFGVRRLDAALGTPALASQRTREIIRYGWTAHRAVATSLAMMIDPPNDEHFMREALRQAQKAYDAREVPVGAVVVRAGHIIARASNQVELLRDATAHAEMLALTQAEAAVGDWRLTDCDLYVTKEPCPMCAGALVHTRIRRLVFGCTDPAAGAAGSAMNLLQMPTLNHRCDVASGVLLDECAAILQSFFRKRREQPEPSKDDR